MTAKTGRPASYLANYIQIYVWQILAIATSLLAMFIVVPQISSQHAMFGIYTICVSLTVFLSYGDFGFITAGFRYASDAFANHDLEKETRIVGFVGCVLFCFVAVYAVAVLFVAANPRLLIARLTDPVEMTAASEMLVILACFSPTVVLQRMLEMIFGVRIEDYLYQRIIIAGNLAKIASVFFFFGPSGYNIVGYFLATQAIALACCLTSFAIASVRYRYDIRLLLRSFRLSRDVYALTKRLAFMSMWTTLAWVLYFELDSIVIGRVLGPAPLAIYAVGVSLAASFRTLLGTVYAPFRARINHLVALNDEPHLASLYRGVLIATLPIIVFPALSVIVLMKPFIFCWVGPNYGASVLIAQLLVARYLTSFSGNPANFLLVARERVRELYVLGSIPTVIFWGAILLSLGSLSVLVFGLFKFIAAVPAQIYYLFVSRRCLRDGGSTLWATIRPGLVSAAFLVVSLALVRDLLPAAKSPINVGVVIATGGAASLMALLLYAWQSPEFRSQVAAIVRLGIARRRQATVGI